MRNTEGSKWIIFFFCRSFDLSFELCGYFDNRPRINICLFFFNLTLILPIRNSWSDECNPPKWGIAYHNQTFWIYRGGNGNMKGGNKWWTINMPWQYDWVRTSNLKKDGTWEHETRLHRKNFYEDKWKELIWNETYPYRYVLENGTVQERLATVKVEEREWRWYWFKWLPLTKKVCKTIAIEFNDEVGERTGSWKGGTIGCGWDILHGELPEQALRRMEATRRFN